MASVLAVEDAAVFEVQASFGAAGEAWHEVTSSKPKVLPMSVSMPRPSRRAVVMSSLVGSASGLLAQGASVEGSQVAVVHGDTWNIGHELFLVADIRIASAETRFAQDENTHGRFPGGGSTVRFRREAGWGKAMRYMLTGDHWGLRKPAAWAWCRPSPRTLTPPWN